MSDHIDFLAHMFFYAKFTKAKVYSMDVGPVGPGRPHKGRVWRTKEHWSMEGSLTRQARKLNQEHAINRQGKSMEE